MSRDAIGRDSPAQAIFFDLETTDLHPIGQILNFCFIAVDANLQPVETFKGDIKISRLQLPRAGAILANRVDVREHQERAEYTENQAVFAIREFLVRHIASSKAKVPLVGFNSAGFDLDYLRTVFIRNGVSPYLNFVSRDLLLLAQHLLLVSASFRKTVLTPRDDGEKTNIKLERLCQLHQLLDGQQLHESEHDVLLTIELAKVFRNTYDVDICQFEPYAVKALHKAKRGQVFNLIEPLVRGATLEKYRRVTPSVLIEADERYALWVNVEKFLETKDPEPASATCVRFMKYAANVVMWEEASSPEAKFAACGDAIFQKYKGLTVSRYFTERERGMVLQDLEQHIYRLTPQQIDGLGRAIHQGEEQLLRNNYQRQIWRRYFLENWQPDLGNEQEFRRGFSRYVDYRYGGKMLLEMVPEGTERAEKPQKFHPTIAELFTELDERMEQAKANSDSPSIRLLESLHAFYDASEVCAVSKEAVP